MLFFIVGWHSLYALPVSKKMALEIARTFMDARNRTLEGGCSRMLPTKVAQSGQDAIQPLIYAFNAANEGGFVLVSGDDRTAPILGYCDDGYFDEENIPANMQGWIEGIKKQIEYAISEDISTQENYVDNAPLAPLLSSRWGQDAPYNANCPVINNQRCPTGCLATAVAQIMYYHKWPQSATSQIASYRTSSYRVSLPQLPSTTFKWDQMHDQHKSNEPSDAVAELMTYVGYSLNMDYCPEASGASDYYVPKILCDKFGYYSPTIRRENRDSYSISQWDELIYNEIKHNRPVLYTGFTPNYEGHAFVCDGYDSNGLYHINWGWDGYCDGYFRLSVLNPNNTSSSGAASTEDGFTEGQTVVVGIQKEEMEEPLQIWNMSSFTNSGNTLSAKGVAAAAGNYIVSLVELSSDGSLTPVLTPVNRTMYKNSGFTAYFDVSALAEGTHRLAVAVCKSGTSNWIRVGSSSQYAVVDVTSSGLTIEMHPIVNFSITNIEFPKTVITGRASRLNVGIKNNADEYSGILKIYHISENGTKTEKGNVSFAMLPREEFTTSASIVIPEMETFTIQVVNGSTSAVMKERTFYMYDISVETSYTEWDPTSVTVKFKNNTPIDYNDNIIATIYQNGIAKALGSVTRKIEIPAEGSTAVNYVVNFDKQKKYYLTFQHIAGELTTSKKLISDKVYVDYTTDGIESINASVDEASYCTFNLAGQRVSKDYKGVAIKNGKKVIKK